MAIEQLRKAVALEEVENYHPAEHFDVLTPKEFLKDFEWEAAQAKKRVYAQVMEMQLGRPQEVVCNALFETAAKGLDTKLNVDYYTRLVTDGNFNSMSPSPVFRNEAFTIHNRRRREKQAMFDRMQIREVTMQYLNSPKTQFDIDFPVRGRNHIKLFVVDDIAWIGGVNITDYHLDAVDFMVKIKDPAMTAVIIDQFQRAKDKKADDQKYTFDNGETSILVDGGTPGKSIILDTAVEMVDQSKRSVFTATQFLPNGKLLEAIHKSQKDGKHVAFVTQNPRRQGGVFLAMNFVNYASMFVKRKAIPLYVYPGNIHAKLHITDMKTALFGSHNFTESGVLAGTEEIAMQSTNPYLVRNLVLFFLRMYRSCEPLTRFKTLKRSFLS